MLARCRNAPSTPFFITAAIPLIPGSTLYYCMNAAVSNDLPAAEHFGEQTLLVMEREPERLAEVPGISREKAKAMIMAGEVLVDNEREDKAGSMFPEEVEIVLKGKPLPYVSRGGLKLEKAMKNFDLTLDGKVCMDVGASTGGFTDCMLQNGAVKVYSVDVGHGQLDWKLRNDPRVVCMERTNIRYVVPEDIEERPSFVSIDVSFISLTKVLLPVRNLMEENGEIAALIKPQFEAGREKVGKKGVVRDPAVHKEVIEMVISYAKSISFGVRHLEFSPIKGPEGNIEYLVHLVRLPDGVTEEETNVDVDAIVKSAHNTLDK